MYYPTVADPTQTYDTAFVRDVARELHATKRLRAQPNYRDHVVVAESWTRAGDYTLLRYPAVPPAPPAAVGLLRALLVLQRARLVHGHLDAAALRGGRLAHFREAIDMAGAVTRAADYFFPEAGPPDKRALGRVAQGIGRYREMSRHEAILELVQGWRTWDLYDLSGLVDHPLAAQCRSDNPKDRPTVAACLAAF